jgi:hypothetical protein
MGGVERSVGEFLSMDWLTDDDSRECLAIETKRVVVYSDSAERKKHHLMILS